MMGDRAGTSGRDASSSSSSSSSFESLPVEVVQEILVRRVRDAGGAVPTACALTCVSRTFRAAIESAPELFFENVDLSYGFCAPTDARMRAYAKRGVFKRTRRLNLSGCVKLTDATLRTLAETCESLEDVTLSGGSFTKDGMFAFIDAVRGLKGIHVDMSAPKMTPTDALGALQRFVERNAETLEKISCGREAPYAPAERRAFTKASNRLFDAIRKCTGLRVLNLTNCGEDVRFPLFELQRACPHLSELRLNHMGGEPGWRVVGRANDDFEDTCWRHLRVLEVAVSMETTSVGHRYGHSNVDDAVLVSLLYGSIETIEELDITGCTHLGDWRDVVWDRMPLRLKTLRCARTPLSSDDGAVTHVLAHLCTSLETLELGCVGANASNLTDAAFAPILAHTGPELPLRVLRVPGSSLSAAVARALTSGPGSRFPNLRALDVASCRGLPRDVRRVSLATFPRDNVHDVARALADTDTDTDASARARPTPDPTDHPSRGFKRARPA